MEKTPFGHFLKMPSLLCERTILEESCGVWEGGRKGFKLGNSIIPFKVSDCALILGLSSHGEIVDFGKDGECTELQKRFFDKCPPTTKNIIRHLQQMIMYEMEGALEDFTKMMLLRYVDEIERLGDYAWADAVHRFLIKHIPDASDWVRSKKRGESQSAGYINGCAILINVFVYEHSNIVKPKSIACDKVPRLFKWESIKHHRKNSAAMLIEGMKDFQVTQGTSGESKPDSLESIIAKRERLFEENSGVRRDEDKDEDESTGYSMSSFNEDFNKDECVENDQDTVPMDDLDKLDRKLIGKFLNLEMNGAIVFENKDTFCTRKQIFELLTGRCLEGDYWFSKGDMKKAKKHLTALREMISTTTGLVAYIKNNKGIVDEGWQLNHCVTCPKQNNAIPVLRSKLSLRNVGDERINKRRGGALAAEDIGVVEEVEEEEEKKIVFFVGPSSLGAATKTERKKGR
ncbi:hypothetical protein QJS04_geneDACA000896 [Acorus gramineus]|uniref:Uncharacterized protein n=1 Tax=Acorus gramineus TaxID=55184 RepID=A0AAV9AC25_ACOGR|nr:hypothetical protein QJS04_geneDACA000896 [Acorus gramineus]